MPGTKHDNPQGKPPAGGAVGKGKGKLSAKGHATKPQAKRAAVRHHPTVLPQHMRRMCNSSNIYTVLFVFIVSAIFVGGGIALIVVGHRQTITDLYIVGGISLFIAAVSIAVGIAYCCQPLMGSTRVKAVNDDLDKDDSFLGTEPYVRGSNLDVDVDEVIRSRRPSVQELYGNEPMPGMATRRAPSSETFRQGRTVSPEEAPRMMNACAPPPEVALPGVGEFIQDPPTVSIPMVRYEGPEEWDDQTQSTDVSAK